jgi:hypothetical protein
MRVIYPHSYLSSRIPEEHEDDFTMLDIEDTITTPSTKSTDCSKRKPPLREANYHPSVTPIPDMIDPPHYPNACLWKREEETYRE